MARTSDYERWGISRAHEPSKETVREFRRQDKLREKMRPHTAGSWTVAAIGFVVAALVSISYPIIFSERPSIEGFVAVAGIAAAITYIAQWSQKRLRRHAEKRVELESFEISQQSFWESEVEFDDKSKRSFRKRS